MIRIAKASCSPFLGALRDLCGETVGEERTDGGCRLLWRLFLNEVAGVVQFHHACCGERLLPAGKCIAECRILHSPDEERGTFRECVACLPEGVVPCAGAE